MFFATFYILYSCARRTNTPRVLVTRLPEKWFQIDFITPNLVSPRTRKKSNEPKMHQMPSQKLQATYVGSNPARRAKQFVAIMKAA